jgi:GNAT superfamily N-acetyltransferase
MRAATREDAAAINELIVAADEAVQGWSDESEADLLDWWRLIDLEQDSWVVEHDGSITAYGVVLAHGENAALDGFVHPTRTGLGLGAWLLAKGEARARERELPVARTWCLERDDVARHLFENLGYREVRRYYRMLIELEAPPLAPEWPEGFHISTFEPDDARAFHTALGEAFVDEWTFISMPFEQWVEHRIEAPDFDPTLWFIVREGDEIAAVLRADPERGGAGWVGVIGVRKPWRKRGLGLALLLHTFGEFYRRGQPRIALGVDAQNPTGATRLYERAGMRVAYEAVAFEKALT